MNMGVFFLLLPSEHANMKHSNHRFLQATSSASPGVVDFSSSTFSSFIVAETSLLLNPSVELFLVANVTERGSSSVSTTLF